MYCNLCVKLLCSMCLFTARSQTFYFFFCLTIYQAISLPPSLLIFPLPLPPPLSSFRLSLSLLSALSRFLFL